MVLASSKKRADILYQFNWKSIVLLFNKTFLSNVKKKTLFYFRGCYLVILIGNWYVCHNTTQKYLFLMKKIFHLIKDVKCLLSQEQVDNPALRKDIGV